MTDKPSVVIVGAGFTGCAIAHDLSLRGFHVTVVERGDIANGTSGRTHGLLHSGGRYCVNDHEAGKECIEENIILRKITPQCIEYNGGLFVALNESDAAYAPEFEKGAEACHIPIEKLDARKTLQFEPNLNPKTIFSYLIPDGSFDPLRLALSFAATAKKNGAEFLTYHEVVGLLINGQGNAVGVEVLNRHSGQRTKLNGNMVVNATGAWAGQITAMAKGGVPVVPTPGIMVAYDQRLVQRVINRLNEPGDGDIIIPQRRMAVVGTTSYEVEDVDYIPVVEEQIKQMYKSAVELVPAVASTRQRGVYMSARPLIKATTSGRSISRTFKCYDHAEDQGIGGFVTITGGKATTCRAMAEKTADLVCKKLGIHVECSTHNLPLVSYRQYYYS